MISDGDEFLFIEEIISDLFNEETTLKAARYSSAIDRAETIELGKKPNLKSFKFPYVDLSMDEDDWYKELEENLYDSSH